jgi:hypothetical protein
LKYLFKPKTEFLICGDINTSYLIESNPKKKKTSLIINNIQSVFFLLGDSPASEFYVPRFSEQSVSSIFMASACRKKNWDKLFPVILPAYTNYEDGTNRLF